MATSIKTYLGTVYLLGKNPRTIRDSAFTMLCESIERDPEFLMARGVVVWQVPEVLPVIEGEKCPFRGQEGKLVIIGGNQRCKAFLSLGKTEIKPEWIVEAKDENGNWWSVEKAERFTLIDNSPVGIAGEDDTKKMFENFSERIMKMSGVDFAEFVEKLDIGVSKDPADEAEEGENGEKSEELKEFIANREQTRKDLKEIDDTGFHLLLVFDSFEQKAEFISKAGLTGKNKATVVNQGIYLDLVFESYGQKMEFVEKAGLADSDEAEGEDAGIMFGMFADGRAFARKFGIELKETMLHFRDRKVDSQLADMAASDEGGQKTIEQIETEQFEEAKKVATKAIKGKKGKEK